MAAEAQIKYVGEVADAVGEAAKKVAEAVKEVEAMVNTVADTIDTEHMVRIRVANLTDTSFKLMDEEHDNGNWANIDSAAAGFDVFPAAVLGPKMVMECVTQDTGLLTGTKGEFAYQYVVDDRAAAPMTIHRCLFKWDNPALFIWKGNSADAFSTEISIERNELPKFGRSSSFRTEGLISGGRKAKAMYYVTESDTPGASLGVLSLAIRSINSQ